MTQTQSMQLDQPPRAPHTKLDGVPKTMFSLLYNSTFTATFRQGAWDNLDETLKWFEVEDPTFVGACRKVEYAAFLMRRYTRDANASEPLNHNVVKQALSDLEANVPVMFDRALKEAARHAHEHRLPSGSGEPPVNETTLSLTYELLYNPTFRQQFCTDTFGSITSAETHAALLSLAKSLQGSDNSEVEASLEQIGSLLSQEYKTVGWKICW